MNEQVELQIPPVVPSPDPIPVPALDEHALSVPDAPPPEAPVPEPREVNWPRIAYIFEFMLAIVALFTAWSQIAGQGHVDLLPWYLKLVLSFGAAWLIVRFTMSIASQRTGWTAAGRLWLIGIVLMLLAITLITFYYHLHEVPDEPDTDENATSVRLVGPVPPPLPV